MGPYTFLMVILLPQYHAFSTPRAKHENEVGINPAISLPVHPINDFPMFNTPSEKPEPSTGFISGTTNINDNQPEPARKRSARSASDRPKRRKPARKQSNRPKVPRGPPGVTLHPSHVIKASPTVAGPWPKGPVRVFTPKPQFTDSLTLRSSACASDEIHQLGKCRPR